MAAIVPTPAQIRRRCLGILRTIDMVLLFQRYTNTVMLLDFLCHGVQYLALVALARELLVSDQATELKDSVFGNVDLFGGTLALVAGLSLTAAGQLLIFRLRLPGSGACRLPAGSLLLRGGLREAACPALLCLLVVTVDLAVLRSRPVLKQLRGVLDIEGLMQPASSSGPALGLTGLRGLLVQVHRDQGGAFAGSVVCMVIIQALLRLCMIVVLWMESRKVASALVPP
eukprot:TRINITY_DN122887_c0_g1_i1.p1 TRINITY_DN122887_c0_g1~~TRINITY_DN122887_c0_g1_i1.p1  ORF type:complete len:254 (+),score=37.02 TRINITY_DN122887_c0_g1_i1:79-762(+)